MNGTPGDTSRRGTDLILRKMADGTNLNIGNVYQYEFDDTGKFLAYSVDAAGKMGNGVYVTTLATGEIRVLDTATKEYDALTWRADSKDLLVLRGEKPAGKDLKENTLVVWKDVTGREDGMGSVEGLVRARRVRAERIHRAALEPGRIRKSSSASRNSRTRRRRPGRPAGRRAAAGPADKVLAAALALAGRPRRTGQGQPRHLALEGHRTAVRTDAPDCAGAARDVRVGAPSRVQEVRPSRRRRDPDGVRDGRRSVGASARRPIRTNSISAKGSRPAPTTTRSTPPTGARTLIAKRLFRTFGTSPDSQWFLYLEAGHVIAHNLVSRQEGHGGRRDEELHQHGR